MEHAFESADDRLAFGGLDSYLSASYAMGLLQARIILAAGHAWRGSQLPVGVLKGVTRECYSNAGRLALDNPRYRYCEGYAVGVVPIPLHHAWCIDEETGRVVDPTWPTTTNCLYRGLVFQRDFLVSVLAKSEVWGIWAEMPHPCMHHMSLEEMLDPEWVPVDCDRPFLKKSLFDLAAEPRAGWQ